MRARLESRRDDSGTRAQVAVLVEVHVRAHLGLLPLVEATLAVALGALQLANRLHDGDGRGDLSHWQLHLRGGLCNGHLCDNGHGCGGGCGGGSGSGLHDWSLHDDLGRHNDFLRGDDLIAGEDEEARTAAITEAVGGHSLACGRRKNSPQCCMNEPQRSASHRHANTTQGHTRRTTKSIGQQTKEQRDQAREHCVGRCVRDKRVHLTHRSG